MKKNTNKKGFTLVELIIVATIMVMIMGAILNWIRPMNKFYQRTQSLADTNDVGSMLMDYVDDELRYATNIVVLQGYEGVPDLSGQFLKDSSGNAASNVKFTNALILDNSHNVIRGSRFADYVADSNASRRKKAYGCILKATVGNDGINTDTMSCLGTEPLYNDYGCKFEAYMNILENGSSCVTINMELTRSRREGTGYVFDQPAYNQSRDFELVNVNLKKNDGMRSEFYTSLGDAPNMDYSKFARTYNSGTNPNAASMYVGGEDNTFTYILYTKLPVKAEKVKITLYDAPGSTHKLDTQQLNSGDVIPENIINSWKNIGEGYTTAWVVDGSGYSRTVFTGIYTSGDEPIDDYKSKGVITNIDFFIRTAPDHRPMPADKLEFYDRFDDGGNDFGATNFLRQTAGIWDDYHYVSGVMDGPGDALGKYTFVGWLREEIYVGTPDPSSLTPPSSDPDDADANMLAGWFVNGQEYFSSDTYLAVYKENPTITFEFVQTTDDGGLNFGTVDVPKEITADNLTSAINSVTTDANNNAPADKVFEKWNILDPNDPSVELGQLKADVISTLDPAITYTVVAKYKSNTYPGMFEVTVNTPAEIANHFAICIYGNNDEFGIFEETDSGTREVIPIATRYETYFGADCNFHANSTIRIYSKQPFSLQVGNYTVGTVSTDTTVNYFFDPTYQTQEYCTIG
jgi:prepilin-type N-terminal cleavage/methylation domain-containing protein